MAIDPETIGAAGGTGGIVAAVIAFFHREKINDLKDAFEAHKEKAVTVDRCVPCQGRASDITNNLRLEMSEFKKDIKSELFEMKGDIKELLKHSLQRRQEDKNEHGH